MNLGEMANRLFGGAPGRGQSFLYAAEQRLTQRMARAAPRVDRAGASVDDRRGWRRSGGGGAGRLRFMA